MADTAFPVHLRYENMVVEIHEYTSANEIVKMVDTEITVDQEYLRGIPAPLRGCATCGGKKGARRRSWRPRQRFRTHRKLLRGE